MTHTEYIAAYLPLAEHLTRFFGPGCGAAL